MEHTTKGPQKMARGDKLNSIGLSSLGAAGRRVGMEMGSEKKGGRRKGPDLLVARGTQVVSAGSRVELAGKAGDDDVDVGSGGNWQDGVTIGWLEGSTARSGLRCGFGVDGDGDEDLCRRPGGVAVLDAWILE